ncbi:hypothetical protein [Oceanihabitans sediminis]
MEHLTRLIWVTFGIIGGANYYSKTEYFIVGLMFVVFVLYSIKLMKNL